MLPNWYGIGFEWRGHWSDPLLHYKGRTFYLDDIHDGLWELYIEDGGDLRIREDFEAMAADAVDTLHKPIEVLGRTINASDIAREMLSDDWEAYVNSCIAHLIAMEEIKEVR